MCNAIPTPQTKIMCHKRLIYSSQNSHWRKFVRLLQGNGASVYLFTCYFSLKYLRFVYPMHARYWTKLLYYGLLLTVLLCRSLLRTPRRLLRSVKCSEWRRSRSVKHIDSWYHEPKNFSLRILCFTDLSSACLHLKYPIRVIPFIYLIHKFLNCLLMYLRYIILTMC